MKKSAVPFLFLALLAVHAAHVFEEVWGRFQPIERVFGLGWFLALNWVFLAAPMTIFLFILLKKRPAYTLGMFYAGLMTLNGLGHNIALAATGRYFGGFAGSVSGIPMIILGAMLLRALLDERRPLVVRRKPINSQTHT
ncbi:MAG: hypothetical protein NTZ26_15240 [Candidatus Aminicenantes bacterium]|nr:hypothetical protein [Candidatus Aminicenantes bacterium]